MTSPGLKRPLDYEFASKHEIKTESETISELASDGCVEAKLEDATGGGGGSEDQQKVDQHISPHSSDGSVAAVAATTAKETTIATATNGNKRRCTATNFHHSLESDNVNKHLATTKQCTSETTINTNANISPSSPGSLIKDNSTTLLKPIDDDIDALIKDELHKTLQDGALEHQTLVADGTKELPILTARQTQSICEKLIRDRERKLREEYDRKLACKLAEQYDLFAKAKYLDTIVESTCTPTTSPIPASSATNHPSITNAIAFMQKSAVPHNVSPVSSIVSSPNNNINSIVATCTAQNLPSLSNLAVSLTANGHPSVLQSPHLTAFNLRQHAAAAAIRHAQVQQHPHQHLHPHQHQGSHQLSIQNQHRTSLCPSNNSLPLGPVLLTSNLDEQLAVPEALFTLFGVFGDVVRVKILFNKKDNALIQMADANQAQVAQGFLDKQKIFGKVIRVTRSKHQLVQMPRDGNQSDAGLTKDFTNSPLHRFKIPGSRNYLNIYPPSNTLHISNIPATVDEKGLHKAFKEQCGFEFTTFKFFPKDRKMALMKFSSIEHATIALIKMHNFQISGDNNLRVSFSKSSI